MLRYKNIERLCCVMIVLTLLLSIFFMAAAARGVISGEMVMGYENRLFDQSRVHTIDIIMNEGEWEEFLKTATSEEYAACQLVIDGESYKNAAIRGKGNTSLSSVAAYGNDRYSFKVEFDHYQTGSTYHGLDKLSLNNLIQDNTYMKDYMAYTLMNKMGVAAPLCSFVKINVNGEYWGLYLAVEGVEDAFLQRNYGKQYGELYKPDSMSFGGGRGNGRDFDMDEMTRQFGGDSGESPMAMPDMGNFPTPPQGMTPDMGSFPGGFDPARGGDFKMPARASGGFGGFGSSTDVKLQYTDDDPDSYANIFNNAKTDITRADQNRLIASLKALSEGDASVVDQEAVIRYMAVHHFLCNDDSYTGMMVHNYYLYEQDGVLSMIPWDYNLAYGGFSGGFSGGDKATSTVNTSIDRLVTMGADSDRPMADWITAGEEYTRRYHEVYQEFMTTVFDSGWFQNEIDRVTAMIAPYVETDPTAFCTYEEFQTGAQTLREFCLRRAKSVSNQLSGNPETVDAQDLDLSAMGTMNGMGGPGGPGGGFGQKTQGENAMGQERTRPNMGGSFDKPAMENQQPSYQAWLWITVCAGLLIAGLLWAQRMKTNR